ncbi:MAG: hypothetical protein KAS16_09460 [Thermoplasmata archaeon]|nr:hypothetical protein [Thermoplasmata archaeon]
MDSKGFVSEIEAKMVPIAPIVEFAIRKQIAEVGATKELMNPQQAVLFIKNLTEALELFLGEKGAKENQKFMTSTLRKYAPDYFEEKSLI